MRAAAALAVALAACGAAAHPRRVETEGILVMVSADAEWHGVRQRFSHAHLETSPYGEWFRADFGKLGDTPVRFFHGGWGKIAAAGSTQYAIDAFRPALIVNLGTCGGFGAGAHEGDVILADETVVYDIVERMGDPDEAIHAYTSKPEVARWPAALRSRVRVGHLVSGDRDLAPDDVAQLAARYHAIAGDWESGAIAWVAARGHTPVLILREVSDVVDASGDPTYGAPDEWQRRADASMGRLIDLFVAALPSIYTP